MAKKYGMGGHLIAKICKTIGELHQEMKGNLIKILRCANYLLKWPFKNSIYVVVYTFNGLKGTFMR